MCSDKTKWVFDDDDHGTEKSGGREPSFGGGGPDDFTKQLQRSETAKGSKKTDVYWDDDEKTRVLDGRDGGKDTDFSEKTIIFSAATEEQVQEDAEFEANLDPVVGWLVVLKGPGKGNSVPIGHGMNLIGRKANQRVQINFGDTMISGEDHAKIMYEDREFFISHGSGKNITKLNGKMIPNMVPLKNYDLIRLTPSTTLAFVALCGSDFDWSMV